MGYFTLEVFYNGCWIVVFYFFAVQILQQKRLNQHWPWVPDINHNQVCTIVDLAHATLTYCNTESFYNVNYTLSMLMTKSVKKYIKKLDNVKDNIIILVKRVFTSGSKDLSCGFRRQVIFYHSYDSHG